MRIYKKLAVTLTMLGMLGVAGTAYAAVYQTPADIAASVTGKSITDVNQERASGKTYGTIAKEAGKLEEFQAQMLEQKKAILKQRVTDGQLTQQQADQIYERIKSNQALCNGTGNCSGLMGGQGMGRGAGNRMGSGMGMGCRLGLYP
ncbi:DUF2680 domain-containing protein [Desulfosporosinus sp. FKA]|uniref:DUF2680 domain-containing protein n=1 Tax=Desulfosporosinus sp. FKA TaxID=1969834 RepID=UPI000B49DE52|nr:DUF2680 domain-containing protein [Desulfosporosinus sp. FKA]